LKKITHPFGKKVFWRGSGTNVHPQCVARLTLSMRPAKSKAIKVTKLSQGYDLAKAISRRIEGKFLLGLFYVSSFHPQQIFMYPWRCNKRDRPNLDINESTP